MSGYPWFILIIPPYVLNLFHSLLEGKHGLETSGPLAKPENGA
jgi:hypothetical protein